MTQMRKELLLLLADIGIRYPEMRLGQLLSWFASSGSTGATLYDVQDGELIAAMRAHLANPLARTAPSALEESIT